MSYSELTVKDLRWIATERKIPGRSKATRKAQLVELIERWQELEQSAKSKVIEAIGQTPDAYHRGDRSNPCKDFYAETIRKNYPSWQAIAGQLDNKAIALKKEGDFALCYGADAIKFAIAAECLLTIESKRDGVNTVSNVTSGVPAHAIGRYNLALRQRGYFINSYEA